MALKDNPPDPTVIYERTFPIARGEDHVDISPSTLNRMRRGILSRVNGQVIYLRWARRQGVGVVTSMEAVDEFDFKTLNPK